MHIEIDGRRLDVPAPLARWRAFPLDDALLLFDRDSGFNALCDGPELVGLRQRAPRSVQFALTNRCNLACAFCCRDPHWKSEWTIDSAFELLRDLAQDGVLEVAFGGGEPLVMPDFARLLRSLRDETPLAASFTTNGLGLDEAFLDEALGAFAQVRVSIYDDNPWRERFELLARRGVCFGANYLVTPQRLPQLELVVLDLAARGCSDVLLLSYNGAEAALHLDDEQAADLARRVDLLARALRGRVTLKLSVCWGERMESVPRLLQRADCGAGREFVVITSDRRMQPCSFHQLALPFRTAADVLATWRSRSGELAGAAAIRGCARAN
jgi:MoaA/NifB/PqqE/SkfB family radical SAM enzyme